MERDAITGLLTDLASGRREAGASAEELMPAVYAELRRLAGAYMQRESAGHTLQPTALVHEAYERLVDQSRVDWKGRTHFLAVGAQVMRRLLIDHARGRNRQKRGAGRQRVTLSNLGEAGAEAIGPEDLLALDRALTRLAEEDARAATVLELRAFGGLSATEVAAHLGVSERTARSDWAFARAWLQEALTGERGPDE